MLIKTERLIIREFVGSDFESVHEYASNPEVTKYMLWGPNSEENTRLFFERVIGMQQQNPRYEYELAVVLKENGALIGGCSIYIEGTNGEIGYCFNPRYWGNGYATEATRRMIRFGMEELRLHRICATYRPHHLASAKVLEKSGMKKEGHLREHIWSKGRYHDSYLYSILESEFDKNGVKFNGQSKNILQQLR